jgi:hypothetical protein
MAKATITTKSGAAVTVEGTEDEVARLVSLIDGDGRTVSDHQRMLGRSGKGKPTPKGLISELIVGGFFAKPRGLGEVKAALEQRGHYYPVTSLSPLMLRLMRQKELRRIKDKNRWTYVE